MSNSKDGLLATLTANKNVKILVLAIYFMITDTIRGLLYHIQISKALTADG